MCEADEEEEKNKRAKEAKTFPPTNPFPHWMLRKEEEEKEEENEEEKRTTSGKIRRLCK